MPLNTLTSKSTDDKFTRTWTQNSWNRCEWFNGFVEQQNTGKVYGKETIIKKMASQLEYGKWYEFGWWSSIKLENIGCGVDVNFDIGLGRMLCDTCPVSGWMGYVCSFILG